jgi:hypothetical protein
MAVPSHAVTSPSGKGKLGTNQRRTKTARTITIDQKVQLEKILIF